MKTIPEIVIMTLLNHIFDNMQIHHVLKYLRIQLFFFFHSPFSFFSCSYLIFMFSSSIFCVNILCLELVVFSAYFFFILAVALSLLPLSLISHIFFLSMNLKH